MCIMESRTPAWVRCCHKYSRDLENGPTLITIIENEAWGGEYRALFRPKTVKKYSGGGFDVRDVPQRADKSSIC